MSGKTLQLDIIERFLTPEEFKTFLDTYQKNRKHLRESNRFAALEKPVTPEDLQFLKEYLSDTTVTTKQLAERNNIKLHQVDYRVSKTALRLIAQNKEKLGL